MERNTGTGLFRKRSFLIGMLYYAVISLVIIIAASPLFRVLGFEYSGFIALFASIHLLFYTAAETIPNRTLGYWNSIKALCLPVFILANIPLIISCISTFFIPNCSLWDGLIIYIEIVYPTALIALLCGIAFGVSSRSKRRTNIYLALFWILTLIISLLPGYFSGRIYTYGWQYGYFPGFVWDEAMELQSGYWWSRLWQLFIFLYFVLYLLPIRKNGSNPKSSLLSLKNKTFKDFAIYMAFFLILNFASQGWNDNSEIEEFLHDAMLFSHVQVHYSFRSLSADEMKLLEYNIMKYQGEIDSIYHLDSFKTIDVYIFPTPDDLYKYVGTREASISKPWRHSIYIIKQNLESLKHELAHIMLADYGSFPFDISYSTGLTEGAAVAIEDDYDGIESADYFSARILQMKLALGVSEVMAPSGFLASAPSQSYVLSGSFSKYLIGRFGPEKFLKVYKERDFDDVYHVSLTELESDWKKQLDTVPMDHYDSLRTLYYFKRTSILKQPCLRRIGKLIKNADVAFKEKDYILADSLYALVITESGRLKAIRGRVLSQLHLNNPNAALAIVDTTASAKETNNLSALRMLRGDVIALAYGDLQKASAEWDEAMKLELGESYFLASFMRKYFLGGSNDAVQAQKILRDLYGLEEVKDKYELVYGAGDADTGKIFHAAQLYLYVSYIENTGKLAEAYKIWKSGIRDYISENKVPGENLFWDLMRKKYSRYSKVF
jgi:hypothetical protein